MSFLQHLAVFLMHLNAFQACILLWLLKNGKAQSIAGLRWCIRLLALVPLCSLIMNVIGEKIGVLPTTYSALRIVIAYTCLNAALTAFLVWLLRAPKSQDVPLKN